jgi:hypothetical protein
VSPAVLYMASELSGDKTGKFLFAGGGRVAELKVVSSKGIKAGADLTAETIAASADDIFMSDEPMNLFA